MSELSTREQAIYLYALKSLPGIGLKYVLAIIRAFPQLQHIPEVSPEELAKKSGVTFTEKARTGLTTQWKSAFSSAERIIDQHIARGVSPLPITSDEYPDLLRLIKDAPPILYAKGDLSVLHNTHAIAVVGTREPTTRGSDTARQIACECAKGNYVIVSGLAKGIDAAAHMGAIEAGGKTIAVFATPLDKVYPVENKKLSEQIAHGFGVLVSEYPFGEFTSKGAFVERDRIQSGLSLAVIPVQTGDKGGTMHTVGFARNQKRLLICPVPSSEEDVPQNKGIWSLLREKNEEKARPLKLGISDIYEQLFALLEKQNTRLCDEINTIHLPLQQQTLTIQQPEETTQTPIPIEQPLVALAPSDADVLPRTGAKVPVVKARVLVEPALQDTATLAVRDESSESHQRVDVQIAQQAGTGNTIQSLPLESREPIASLEPVQIVMVTEVQLPVIEEVAVSKKALSETTLTKKKSPNKKADMNASIKEKQKPARARKSRKTPSLAFEQSEQLPFDTNPGNHEAHEREWNHE